MDLSDLTAAELQAELDRRQYDVDLKGELIKFIREAKLNTSVHSHESVIGAIHGRVEEVSINQLNAGTDLNAEECISIVEMLQSVFYGESYFEKITDFI